MEGSSSGDRLLSVSGQSVCEQRPPRAFPGPLSPLYEALIHQFVQVLSRVLWENPFDAVVLDIRLPDIDGVDLQKNIREADPVTGTLMLSGAATLEDAVESLNQGGDAFMLKPVEPAELQYRLRTVTGFRRLERELREARAGYNELFTIIHEE